VNKKKFIGISLLLLTLLLCSCTKIPETGFIPLDGSWYWTSDITDESSFTPILDRKELYHLSQKLPEHRGVIFLVSDFTIPPDFDYSDVSFYLGRARIADRVYLNGTFIGGGGKFPPELFTAGYGSRSYQINSQLLKLSGSNRVIVELYLEGTGGLYSQSGIGVTDQVNQIKGRENFYHSRINEFFSFFMMLISLFYFFQFLARPKTKENLWYALINIFTSLYLLPFFVSEIPSINSALMSLLNFNKTFETSCALITCFIATSYIRQIIHEPATENVILIRLSIVIAPIAILYAIPDFYSYNQAQPFFYAFVGVQIMFAIWPLAQGMMKGTVKAKPLLTSFIPVIISVFIYLVVHIILQDSSKPIFTIYGWQCTVLSNLIILSYRMNSLYSEIESLNISLEKEVQDRTRDLIKTNQALEVQILRNKEDLEYALSVQKNFFPKQLPQFDTWQLGYHLQPASGVSGDFFDFFMTEGSLQGIALFDVSGHGLAAGLVTMLCKNIIENCFAMDLPLNTVLTNMSKSIIAQKGEIDNYLVGSLVRLNEDETCELTGAGNQPPILVHTTIHETELLTPPENALQYGMIGLAGLDSSYAVTGFKMHSGDVLILYTDGITEAADPHGIQYGRDMIEKVASQTLFDAPAATAQDVADAIVRSLKRFTMTDSFEDDVTLLVLKRK